MKKAELVKILQEASNATCCAQVEKMISIIRDLPDDTGEWVIDDDLFFTLGGYAEVNTALGHTTVWRIIGRG